ncbi:class I SAM-dependent methyltransferase [Pararhodobacter sp. SW119]|uniref:class I SAM-dependent methyltransferase n=1 Tax=Pararhodobacter sp. SW119 TaxID=2780075 RepID=UPI001ADFE72B|nr:class I SAM-dependent methyltransferase [Pararhodobacter sp. SW119]
MSDWSGGYVSDVEYVPGYYGEQAPAAMDLACIMSGVEPARRPGTNAPFTYCDIGCGLASTISALAAANPVAQFWGIDLMPAHIARAEAFRTAAGIDNLTLVEADVVALAHAPGADLPRFDYIALHGLFSWVSAEVRSGVIAFIDRFLKPGGLVYLGYNTMPGWTDTMPIQKLLIEYAATRQGPSAERIVDAAGFATRMQAAGARGLDSGIGHKLFPDIELPELRTRHYRYLAHEFLNAHWQPRYHIDVVRELAAAKLDFVGSTNLLENFDGIGLSEEAREVLGSVAPGPLRETLTDYFLDRRFRRDVFVRGRREISADTREAALGDVVLALSGPRPPPDKSDWPMLSARFTLKPEVYDPVFDRLEKGPAAIEDLCALVEAAGESATGNELVGMLVGLDLVQPVLHDVPAVTIEACWRHNRVVTHEAFRSVRQNSFTLALPVGHCGGQFDLFQTLILDGLFAGVPAEIGPLSAHVLSRLKVPPEAMQSPPVPEAAIGSAPAAEEAAAPDTKEGTDATPPKPRPAGEIVQNAARIVLDDLLPIWRQLGLIPPRDTD